MRNINCVQRQTSSAIFFKGNLSLSGRRSVVLPARTRFLPPASWTSSSNDFFWFLYPFFHFPIHHHRKLFYQRIVAFFLPSSGSHWKCDILTPSNSCWILGSVSDVASENRSRSSIRSSVRSQSVVNIQHIHIPCDRPMPSSAFAGPRRLSGGWIHEKDSRRSRLNAVVASHNTSPKGISLKDSRRIYCKAIYLVARRLTTRQYLIGIQWRTTTHAI